MGQFLFFLLPFTTAFGQQEDLVTSSDSITMSVDFEDIVVTAQYAPTDTKNALQNIRVINRTTIEQQGANNLEQLLQQDLNVRINQDLILGSGISLLGVGGENIKVMVDGIPVVGRLNGNIDLSQINLNNIERVEIIEGPMSVTYGTDALGGVINLISKKSQLTNIKLSLTQQLETRAESSSVMDAGIRLGKHWLVQVNGGRDWFNGLSEDSTRSVLWNPKEQWFTNTSLRYNFNKDHQLIYQFSYFDEEVQNLGDVRRPTFKPYAFDDYFLTNRTNHSLLHEGTVLKHFYWQNTVGFNKFNREVNSLRVDFDTGEQSNLEGDTTRFNTFIARSVLASQFKNSPINFQLGFDAKHEKGAGGRINDAESRNPGESSIDDVAVFGNLRYEPFKKLFLEAGLRIAHNSRYDAPLIPSLHLKYEVTESLQLRASYGRGFRSPSLKELFLSFIDISHFIIGNPNLQAETSENYQLNISYSGKWKAHQLTAKLGLFNNEISDQIQLFPFKEVNNEIIPTTPDQSIQYAYFNLEELRTQGINAKVNYQWKNISVESGLAIIGFYNPLSLNFDGINTFSYSTEWSGKFGYAIPSTKTQVNFFVRSNDRLISFFPETVDGIESARQQTIDGFTLLDGTLSNSFLNEKLHLTIGVRNLLNIQQVNVTGGNGGVHSGGSGMPIGAGRSFFLRLKVNVFQPRLKN